MWAASVVLRENHTGKDGGPMRNRTLASLTLAGVLVAGGAVVGGQAGLTGAAAQTGTGTVTGRVVWCSTGTVYPYPVPLSPDGSDSGESPDPVPPLGMPVPGSTVPEIQVMPDDGRIAPILPRPPFGPIPAGAVLVAVQGTSLSTRTDENGRFSLGGLQAGQYLTVAAGPVGSASGAVATRVNVQVNAGASRNLGALYLGGNAGCSVVRGIYPSAAEGMMGPAEDEGDLP